MFTRPELAEIGWQSYCVDPWGAPVPVSPCAMLIGYPY
jgi:hypothetical protein